MRYPRGFNKRDRRGYIDYIRKYRKKKEMLERRGKKMVDERMLSPSEWKSSQLALKETGRKTSINIEIVNAQAYVIRRKTIIRYIEELEKRGVDPKISMDDIFTIMTTPDMSASPLDLALINDILKIENPELSGYERRDYISHYIFGSK